MPSSIKTNSVLLKTDKDRWLLFQNPIRTIAVNSIEEIIPALHEIEQEVDVNRRFAAGFLSYEAAPAFDHALTTHPCLDFPLLWFGIYNTPDMLKSLPDSKSSFKLGIWASDTEANDYQHMIQRIKTYLANGDTYQVNYTIRMHSTFSGDPFGLFTQIITAQPTAYAAYVSFKNHAICSASPELFFNLDGDQLVSIPMKGTAPRGKTLNEDIDLSRDLRLSIKNRAENVMIVDMMRNDMGHIAIPGSVEVPRLFDVEKHLTVWQMTSKVTSRTKESITEIFKALFPCASVTGAPKPHTMEIIRELETTPRKIYTGSIGMIGPNRQARFNVAIRTVLVDQKNGTAEYGVGGGIVWDSTADEEYHECQVKSRILTETRPNFQLLESLLWTPEQGYYLLEYHIQRLVDSAAYFDYPVKMESIRKKLTDQISDFPASPLKVRLLLGADGTMMINWESPKPSHAVKVCLAKTPVDSNNIFLYHKTTNRSIYEKALAEKENTDDVILWNEQDEITEASSSNIVVQFGEDYLTPPLACGLLAGTRRAELLDQGKIRERMIHKSRLKDADGIFLINSVRPWREATAIMDSLKTNI